MDRKSFLEITAAGGAAVAFGVGELMHYRATHREIIGPIPAAPGFASADFSKDGASIRIPTDEIGQEYDTTTDALTLGDHDLVKQIIANPIVINGITMRLGDKAAITGIAITPKFENNKPTSELHPQAVMLDVPGNGEWLATMNTFGSDKMQSQHLIDLIHGIGGRLQIVDVLGNDEQIFEATVIPAKYADVVQGAVDAGDALDNIVPKVAHAGDDEQTLFVPVYDEMGRLDSDPSHHLPLGQKVTIKDIRQTGDKGIFVKVVPKRETYLQGQDKKLLEASALLIPPIPVWVDAKELWNKPAEVRGLTETQKVAGVQNNPLDTLVNRQKKVEAAQATPTESPTSTQEPTATKTETPTNTPPEVTQWNIPTKTATPEPLYVGSARVTEEPVLPASTKSPSPDWKYVGVGLGAAAAAGGGALLARKLRKEPAPKPPMVRKDIPGPVTPMEKATSERIAARFREEEAKVEPHDVEVGTHVSVAISVRRVEELTEALNKQKAHGVDPVIIASTERQLEYWKDQLAKGRNDKR